MDYTPGAFTFTLGAEGEIYCSVSRSTEISWAASSAKDVDFSLPWQTSTAQDKDFELPWGVTTALDKDFELPWGVSVPLDVDSFTGFTRGTGTTPQNDFKDDCVIPWRVTGGVIVINNTSTLSVDGTDVKILSANVRSDWDSFCWTVNCKIAGRAGANVCRPNADGSIRAKVGILTINEYSWDFYIENIQESYDFANGGSYDISGRSTTVRIAQPYAAPQTKEYDTNTTYYALVSDELTDSLSDIAYNFDDIDDSSFGLDYDIPADLYSVQNKTTMEVLSEVTNTFGGFIQTARRDVAIDNGNVSGELVFKRRYPEWTSQEWSSQTPDEFLTTGTILSQSGLSYEAKPGYNLAVCTATEYASGEISIVRRDGTSGDVHAPPVSEILLNNQDEQYERARSILDTDGYDQTVYTMSLPLPTKANVALGVKPKLLLPRDLVEVDDLFDTGWRGVVTSVSVETFIKNSDISSGGSDAQTTQTVTVERKHV